MHKGFTPISIFFIAAILLILGSGAFYYAFVLENPTQTACTMEAKQCPDGSYVGRSGPDCEFTACPIAVASSTADPVIGKFCGGIAAFQCPTGYTCKLDGAYPDAGGHCMRPDGAGTLSGQVTIGPNCPVERVGVPCPASPEAYASREFLVLSGDQSKTITGFHADMSGNYIVSLPPGNYVIVSAKTGIGYMSKDLPAAVAIKAGEASMLNISIDTGIR